MTDDVAEVLGLERSRLRSLVARDMVVADRIHADDYELISPLAAERWSSDPLLCATPVVAVSLTRSAEEAPTLDGASLALYLYLPSFEPDEARQMVTAARRPLPYSLPPFDRARERARPSA